MKEFYDRKIKVKCNHCGKIYTKWANELLYHTIDESECECEPFFTIIGERKNENKI